MRTVIAIAGRWQPVSSLSLAGSGSPGPALLQHPELLQGMAPARQGSPLGPCPDSFREPRTDLDCAPWGPWPLGVCVQHHALNICSQYK